MNREIKFRAWDGDKMQFGFLIDSFNGSIWDNNVIGGMNGMPFSDRLEKRKGLILMQFTGLLDKNGKEIYEGDVVKGFKREQQKIDGYEIQDRVYGDIGGFSLFSHPMQEFSYDNDKKVKWLMWRDSGHNNIPDFYYEIIDIEIVGNIYENPELLN